MEKWKASMKVLVWTRSALDRKKDQEILSSLSKDSTDIKIIHLPCIHISELPFQAEALNKNTQAIVTSTKAVEIAARHPELCSYLKGRTTFCFGHATATALIKLGATVVLERKITNSADLAKAICERHSSDEPGEEFLYLGPREPASELEPIFESYGKKLNRIALYQTIPMVTDGDGKKPTPDEVAAWRKQWHGVIAFASPSAVKGFIGTFLPLTANFKRRCTPWQSARPPARPARTILPAFP